MKLPNGHSAIIEMVKLSDYVLSPVHPAGRHKARVFQSALGLTLTDAEELRDMLRDAAKEAEATLGNADEFGIRYIRDFERERSGRRAIIRRCWILRTGEASPRFLTCYVL